MATFSSVTRTHVLQAIAEYDDRGGEQFLATYGFTPAPEYALLHEGARYDCRAVLGVAHRFATGRLATPEEVDNGLVSALTILRKRGFEVSEPVRAARLAAPATRSRAARPARPTARPTASRSTAARDTPPALCPTCSMTLPATGVCDYCS